MNTAALATGVAENPDRQRYVVLDAWRGICALLVTFVHIPLAHKFQGTGWFGNMQMFVDFFFVLSGFVMCHAYGKNINTGRSFQGFMIRRFGRVWPLHAAMLGGFVALELVKLVAGMVMSAPMDGAPFTGPRSLTTLASNLFLTQSFNLHGMTSWNGPAWSIGVEFYAYVVFAVVVLIAGMRTAVFTALATIGLAGVALFAANWIFTTHDFGFFRCLYGFFAGCLVFQAVQVGRPVWLKGATAEFLMLAVLIVFILFTGKNITSLLAPVIFAGVVYVYAFEAGPVSCLLRTSPAQALGLWSYSIYMVHALIFAVEKIVLAIAQKVPALNISTVIVEGNKFWSFGSPARDMAFFAMQIVLTLIVSKLTYDRIEDPARRWFAALARKWESQAEPVMAEISPDRMARAMRG